MLKQVDPQICRIVHFGLEKKMGFTAVALAALLTTGMQMFFHRKNADQQSKDLANKKKAEIMDPEVVSAYQKMCVIGLASALHHFYTCLSMREFPSKAHVMSHSVMC